MAMQSVSSNPINYFSGAPLITSVDLSSQGFGGTLSQTRSWSGNPTAGLTGHGWSSVQDPYLVVYSTFDQATNQYNNPIVGLVQSGQNIVLFDIDHGHASGTWSSRFYGRQSLSYNSTTLQWTMTTVGGQRLVFADLPRDSAGLDAFLPTGGSDTYVSGVLQTNKYGKLLQKLDPSGLVTNYQYDSNGRVAIITETDPVTGVPISSNERIRRLRTRSAAAWSPLPV